MSPSKSYITLACGRDREEREREGERGREEGGKREKEEREGGERREREGGREREREEGKRERNSIQVNPGWMWNAPFTQNKRKIKVLLK